jgi:two-component system cell cycle sensor histidine kinase/response regulator CckA
MDMEIRKNLKGRHERMPTTSPHLAIGTAAAPYFAGRRDASDQGFAERRQTEQTVIVPRSRRKFEGLRRQAEKVVQTPNVRAPKSVTSATLTHALEELRIQGAELEIQNEELGQSRIQAEELQTRYFRHFDLAPVGMIRLDENGIVLEANLLGAQMLGIDRLRLHSATVAFAVRLMRDSQTIFQTHLKNALASGKMESCEISLRGKNGPETFVRMQSIASRGSEGATDLFATLTDLTDHRRAEVQRLELEHKLAERQKLENIGTLAGGIAHDLNNILQVIHSSLDIAKEKAISEASLLKHIIDARQAADRATNLSRRLLTFSKGGSPIKRIVSIREILGSSVEFWLSGSKLRLELSVAHDLLPVTVDPVQFAQVIENVVINAREATPESGRLFVRAINVLPGAAEIADLGGGPCVKIEIEDEGAGMPEYVRERIFEICFTTKAGGSGIGLVTAKSIMDQHGGRIAVKSKSGRGTTVSLFLPAVQQRLTPFSPPRAELPAHGTGRILVIDDEEMILDVTPSILRDLGYDCAVAKDGTEGCEAYVRAMGEGKPFAAVLLDATIPGGLGGEAALKCLLEADPLARVILFSGYADSDLMKKAEELGFKGRLAKPFTSPELAAAIHGLLS